MRLDARTAFDGSPNGIDFLTRNSGRLASV
jgi:hypothetical protein